MPNLPEVIREYVLARNVDPSAWTVFDTGQRFLIGNIPGLTWADDLTEYLQGRGYLVTVTQGDKAGTSWTVTARPWQPGQAPTQDEE